MRLSLCLAALCCVLSQQQADAVLTLQFVGNGLNTTIADGGAFDTNANAGEVSVDLASLAGWQSGASFVVNANNLGADAGSGELSVQADYDFTGGNVAATPIQVSASDLFTVAGAPIDFFRHSISTAGDGTLTSSAGYFSASLPDPGPLNPFDFSSPATYNHSLTIAPPSVLSPFAAESETLAGLGDLGTRLRVANTFTVSLVAGQIGSVQSSTIVNPEPVSLLLSSFGASAFGLGYLRRRKSKAAPKA
ncbi:hypothetical protein Poly24_32200 [Rosistilla carotiformis]|uniref:PEP-CTERM protein-sorting domain-containing protein n=1 Tax=Rosistilla carotiformis TaxID=2528017 RepID=A0A518JVD2_9BACT|nr:hypothetical protein [Rosistilla carotiformis]QDV69504.1 hypothetical protein Poly24_32200 [Rosistilla carotiformis]